MNGVAWCRCLFSHMAIIYQQRRLTWCWIICSANVHSRPLRMWNEAIIACVVGYPSRGIEWNHINVRCPFTSHCSMLGIPNYELADLPHGNFTLRRLQLHSPKTVFHVQNEDVSVVSFAFINSPLCVLAVPKQHVIWAPSQYIAAVSVVWSLLGSPCNVQTALYLFQAMYIPFGVQVSFRLCRNL